MIYRIYTEDINRAEIVKIVARRFDGFTLISGTGYWKSTPEDCLIIEVCGTSLNPTIEDTERNNIYEIARQICDTNNQETVLIAEIRAEINFV